MTSRPKTFIYTTSVRWKTGLEATLSSPGKPGIDIAAPPEFLGVEGKWSPENLYIASVESCLLFTFLTLARAKKLQFVSYESNAEGTLEKLSGKFVVSRIVVRPHIVVSSDADVAVAEDLASQIHDRCFISNSIETEVQVLPEVVVQTS